MKKVKGTHKPNCSWCQEVGTKTPAIWRARGMTRQRYACEEHKDALLAYEKTGQEPDRMSEADYQTWEKL